MSRILLFDAFLAASFLYAMASRNRDSRNVALICVVASVLSHFLEGPQPTRYSTVESGVFLIDLASFAGFAAVALSSDRFWPLWTAGFQLTTLSAHVLKGLQSGMIAQVYAFAERSWSYPIMLVLLIGTWRSVRRRATPRQGAG